MDSICSQLQATVFPHQHTASLCVLLLPSATSWPGGSVSYLTSVLVRAGAGVTIIPSVTLHVTYHVPAQTGGYIIMCLDSITLPFT